MFNRPLIIASNNLDKTAELVACLQEFQVAARSYQDLISRVTFPNEGTTDYVANALTKTRFISGKLPQESVLGDDSGMIISAFPNKFGVQTSRQLVDYPTDTDKNQYLLQLVAGKLRDVELRTDLILQTPHHIYHGFGVFEGTFSLEERGQNGYGFDRILIPKGETHTLAELESSKKFPYLHRTKAVKNLLKKVANNDYENY
ncbi:Nucleoside 5-triphosphatase RdgB (dHAPTP, dITP, XTP-specific) [Pediococcus damnosus]|uniref:Nucleoside 5-triphosphatase RdgB (DHAPTP, dITP, XTP-specific) n=1 Tax=Pediococcus damnosus TaxID=51663 RepID=A0A0R2HM65_9LACO|nr:non-canonical purine NTP pyrophosphatase [Pediococcus damnosus]AMV60324.1 Nucleoside 5-triphosphatase RdgB (dHAPTP, dITP, XTP-specific) [Pediococcus damnosus]AMV62856.1 Nucleoside 5-triphosphatase RdgB (dHAPTP, dITP, XTP-specific) [Pediococcus damnosus]AMV64573.1 Nucleoside 5-triphosphatase RdgB (dHAPTP, dITP, XTP-specific) [Pediococcus damnosus]AMV67260.1 Nucleoside 5-triphosphatase RdgB (dHAPTP, dITP, XTP-specific) [Pediococcus damnosus]AMV69562.1 Nucleoside 5-triphosphatase RdgB (dHAPTP,